MKRRRVIGVVQARMGSSRLPGKVMMMVAGAPLLERMLERVMAAEELDDVVVATTTSLEDAPIVALAERLGVRAYAGHPTDLLDRHLRAVERLAADAVVKIPSDCPLIDPRVIDRVLRAYRADPDRWDYIGNLHPATYPDGNDVEVIPTPMLELAWSEARRSYEREHTTPFIWDQPGRFRVGSVIWETGLDYSMTHRFTIDYPEDYAFVKAVYDALYEPTRSPFSLEAILVFLAARPDVFALNAHLAGINWYRGHLAELRTVRRHETAFPERRTA